MHEKAWVVQALAPEPKAAKRLVEIVREAAVTPSALAREEEATYARGGIIRTL